MNAVTIFSFLAVPLIALVAIIALGLSYGWL